MSALAVLFTLERLVEGQGFLPRRDFEVEYLDELELRGLIAQGHRGPTSVQVTDLGYEALHEARDAAAAHVMSLPVRS